MVNLLGQTMFMKTGKICKNFVFLTISITILISCSSVTNGTQKKVDLQSSFHNREHRPLKDNQVNKAWWSVFDDPVLNELIEIGKKQNLEIKQAEKRFEIAQTQSRIARNYGTVKSSYDGSIKALGNRENRITNTYISASESAQFKIHLDLFGLEKSKRLEAQAREEAALSASEYSELSTTEKIINLYIDYRYFDTGLALSRKNLLSSSRILELTKHMRKAGAANNVDVAHAQASKDHVLSQIPSWEQGKEHSINAFASTLATKRTIIQNKLEKIRHSFDLMEQLEVGVPADLLRNRPDVVLEEKKLTAAAARIGIAKARLYPSISLSGSISITHLIANGLSGGAASAWTFGPSLLAPILENGRLRSELSIAEIEAEMQYLRWKERILQAVQEVEDSLVDLRQERKKIDALYRKERSYSKALKLAKASYQAGTALILDVINADQSLSQARLETSISIRDYAKSAVKLYSSIGAGTVKTNPIQYAEHHATNNNRYALDSGK